MSCVLEERRGYAPSYVYSGISSIYLSAMSPAESDPNSSVCRARLTVVICSIVVKCFSGTLQQIEARAAMAKKWSSGEMSGYTTLRIGTLGNSEP